MRQRRRWLNLSPLALAGERVVLDQCCNGELGYLLLQINVICLLLALMGTTAIVKHPAWFGGVPAAAQSVDDR
jgi:hypothetical protein